MADRPGHTDIVDDIVAEAGRPEGKNRGFAWDISKTYGSKWFDRFEPSVGGQSIVQAAKTAGVDAVSLLVALVSLHRRTPPSWKRMQEVAAALSERKAGQTLGQWLKKFDPQRWKENKELAGPNPLGTSGSNFLAGAIIGSTVNAAEGRDGYVVPTVAPVTEGAKSRSALFDRISPNWENVMPAIVGITNENFEISDTDTRTNIGHNDLLAVLWSLGKTPKWAKNDLENNEGNQIRAIALRLAKKPSDVSLNSWFRSAYGGGSAKRPLPERLLRGVTTGRGAGEAKSQKKKDQLVDENQDNPVLFKMDTGLDVRQSDFNRLFSKYSILTRWYRGDDPTEEEIQNWTNSGVSDYQLSVRLTKGPKFFRSPAWKNESIKFKGVFRDMIGTEQKLPKQLIRQAIVRSWNPGDFAEALRGRPEYLEGNEFQGQTANLQNIYSEVQGGVITSGVKTALKEAALARWSDNQFTAWLRAQPEYASGREHTKKVQNLNATFAAFSGTSLKRVEVPIPQPVSAFDLPDSDRIAGAGQLSGAADARPAESFVNPREQEEVA